MNKTTLSKIFGQQQYELPQPIKNQSAAVLVPIIEHERQLSILFTQRTEWLEHHGGQICFPGGRYEAQDLDLIATALRETEEEIGLVQNNVQIMGILPNVISSFGFPVTPIVGMVQAPLQIQLAPHEVASVFEVPLEFCLQQENYRPIPHIYAGKTYTLHEIIYEDHRIWGLTAKVLYHLLHRVLGS